MKVNPIRKLIKTPGIWRVDGYSNVDISPKRVPRIFISLSEIEEEGLHAPIHLGKTTGAQRWINEPLNRISDLLIGSCWLGGKEGGGKRINRLPPFARTFIVDTSHIKIVSLKEPVELNGHIYESVLPRSAIQFAGHTKNLSNALYAVVPVLKDDLTKYLIVSCYELYRAYIGVSSGFLNNALLNNFYKYFEWRDPNLKVKTRLSRLEQFVAYRGHCSDEGKAWFNLPSNYLRAVTIANKTALEKDRKSHVIKADFPFKGLTTLTVAGKSFKNINGENFVWCVFAANLLHCSKEVYFEPSIEFDAKSNEPLPWEEDISGTPDDMDDPFDEEDEKETEEPPNTKGRKLTILESSNFFGAMRGLKFHHETTGESRDPVYENDLGDISDKASLGEVLPPLEGETPIPKKSIYDSHVDAANRKLSDFIKMIIVFRDLVLKRDWQVITRSLRSTIVVETEIVTTFLHKKSRKWKWHLIPVGDQNRLRQIAWVEVVVGKDQFIYLMEMELKGGEKRSTLCVVGEDFGYMDDVDFETFLEMTAVQNKWPTRSDVWKKDSAQKAAERYFNRYNHLPITHPINIDKEKQMTEEELSKWAEEIESKLCGQFSI